MESTQHGLLEELILAPSRDSWGSFSSGVNEFFSNGWIFEPFDETPILAAASNPPFLGLNSLSSEQPNFPCHFNEVCPFVDGLTTLPPEIQYSSYYNNNNDTPPPIPIGEENPSMVEDGHHLQSLEEGKNCSQVDTETAMENIPAFNMDFCGERKGRLKKVEGQPSKNLMAERRRRKRLNDRLSMLRSVVPKISKMDRTSILGDTIDYMKELLDKINKLQEEDKEASTGTMNSMGNLQEFKPKELLVRNSPKFDAERRNIDTRIEIRCAAKPGLLVSTVNTLEALGLDIQQCVISCFSHDFSMQASCSEATAQRTIISSEYIKQALFRNAGYGGRCL